MAYYRQYLHTLVLKLIPHQPRHWTWVRALPRLCAACGHLPRVPLQLPLMENTFYESGANEEWTRSGIITVKIVFIHSAWLQVLMWGSWRSINQSDIHCRCTFQISQYSTTIKGQMSVLDKLYFYASVSLLDFFSLTSSVRYGQNFQSRCRRISPPTSWLIHSQWK